MPRNRFSLFAGPVAAVIALVCLGYSVSGIPRDYKGKPFRDQYHQSGPQVIPGTKLGALLLRVAVTIRDALATESHLIYAQGTGRLPSFYEPLQTGSV